MSEEENKAAIRRFIDGWNNRDWNAVLDTVGDNFFDHAAPPGVSPRKDGIVPGLEMFCAAFPDLHFTIESLIAEGDKVSGYGILTGTHKGPLMGIPPTGKSVRLESLDLVRMENGKQAEHWGLFDTMGMMVQLGVVPPPGQPG